MVAVAERLYTVEEFWTLPEEMTDGCELIDGRLVKKHCWQEMENGMTPYSLTHLRTIAYCNRALGKFVDERNLGEILIHPAFLVGSNRNQIRKPDVAFIAAPTPTEPEDILALIPALAVEVISPNNTADDVLDKIVEYLAAGTQLVWQMFPRQRIVSAAWSDRTALFRPGDTITAEPVLPGFACPVTDLFPPPP